MATLGPPRRTPESVRTALLAAEDLLLDSVDRAVDRLQSGSTILDELERVIEDVTSPTLYRQFRDLLARLDKEREEIRWRASCVEVHKGLDPIRIALRDLEAGFE